MNIENTNHTANQADGKTKLDVVGEVHVTLSRGKFSFKLDAIVVKELDCDLLAGMSFLRENGIALDIPSDSIIIGKNHIISYSYNAKPDSPLSIGLLRASEKKIVLPGEYLEMKVDNNIPDTEVAFQPRCDSPTPKWPDPGTTSIVGGYIRIANMTNEPVNIKKDQHVCQVTSLGEIASLSTHSSQEYVPPVINRAEICNHSDIIIDPSNRMHPIDKQSFVALHEKYQSVFDHHIGCYNDASGKHP